MKVGLVVNHVRTEEPGYTTTRIAMECRARDHSAWLIGLDEFAYDPDGTVCARARMAPKTNYKSGSVYLADLQGTRALQERIRVTELDVLLLRSDPAGEEDRPWANAAGLLFGRLAAQQGVIVLNDPAGLSAALNKVYFQNFPEEVRPRTLITRSREEIKAFAREMGGTIVLKPLQGSGGQSVFLVREHELSNLHQMIESISRSGYVVAQEYLPQAADGDVRLFMLNGRPYRYKGKYAAFRRVRSGEDMRSNVHAGGQPQQAQITDEMLEVCEIVRPKLVQDGMFLVGLDIVGNKLMEVNVFSPGGFGNAQKFEGVNFSRGVVDALERKVEYMRYYRRNFSNLDMATL